MRKNKFDEKSQPLTMDEVDVILSSLTPSKNIEFMDDDISEAEKEAILRAREVRKHMPQEKMTQFGLLDQDLLSRMTYQSNLGVRYADNKKDELVKQFNRRIVRNYILSAILGGLVVGGVIMAPKVVKKMTSVAVENNLDMSR